MKKVGAIFNWIGSLFVDRLLHWFSFYFSFFLALFLSLSLVAERYTCHHHSHEKIQTSDSNDLLERFEQKATQSKSTEFRFQFRFDVVLIFCQCKSRNPWQFFFISLRFYDVWMWLFFLHFIFVSGVTAEYSNNELLFVYKNLIGNRNASSPIGIFEGRRNTMNAEQLRRSPISGDIPKWFHQLLMLRSDFLKTSRTFLNGIFTFHNTNHFIWGKNRAKTLKLYEFLYLNQFTRVE